jgi:hypothetical protein
MSLWPEHVRVTMTRQKELDEKERLFYNERFLIRSSHTNNYKGGISDRRRFLFSLLLLLLLLGRKIWKEQEQKKV